PSVVAEPLAVFDPVTWKRTVIPGVGLAAASRTVAVTQCCVPTGFVAAAGVRTSVAGGPTPTGVQSENSDVLFSGSVAVVVMTLPSGFAKVYEKVAFPVPFVVTFRTARKVWPSPKPEGSQVWLPKNSSRYVVLSLLEIV